MKKYGMLILALVACATQVGAFGIVNNSGTAGADSIALPFYALDSAGNVVATASGDSIFVSVYYPDGTVAYQDSGAYDDAKITSQAVSSYTHYVWKEAVADIDGASPSQGVYNYVLIVKDLTGADIATPFTGTFQLYAESDFNIALDYIKDALDTLQNQDDWVSHQSTVDTIVDTINAYNGWIAHQTTVDSVLDSISAYDDWIAHQSTIDSVLDSVSAYDDWVAHQTTVDTLVDTINAYDGWIAHQTTVDSVFDSTGNVTVGAIAAGAITAAAVATGAIDADAIADNAIDAGAIATDAITSDKIATNAIGASEIATDAIGSGEIAADAIGSSELAATAVAEVVDGTWDEDTTGHATANSFAVLLEDTTAYQGSAAALDSTAVYGAVIQGIGDSAADVDDVFRNVDTSATLDTSAIGTWLKNNAGGATDIWSNIDTTTTVDSSALGEWLKNNLKAITTVAACTLVTGDSISKLADTIYLATATDFWRNIDTTATVDSSDLGTWMANNLSSASQWTNAKIDSIMILVRSDSVVAYKVWGDSTARTLTTAVTPTDTTESGQYVGTNDPGDGLNFVDNPGFEDDSVRSADPQGWATINGLFTSSGCVPSGVGGRYDFRMVATAGGPMILGNGVGYLQPGHYWLSAYMRQVNGDSVGIVIDDNITCGTSGWVDSVVKISGAMNPVGKEVTIYAAGNHSVGLVFWANSAADYADFDNVVLQYISPLMLVAEDTTQSGDSIATGTASITNANMAGIADSVWAKAFGTSWTAGSMGDSLTTASFVQGAASGLDSTAVYGAVVQASGDRGFVRYDSGAVLGTNVLSISDDTTAADNFETMLDGTGGHSLDLNKLAIRNTTTGDTAVVITSSGGSNVATGVYINGEQRGLQIVSNRVGMDILADTAINALGIDYGAIVWGVSSYDLYLHGNGLRGNVPISDTTRSGKKVGLMPGYWTAADSAGFQGSGSGGGSDTTAIKQLAINNPSYFYGPSATGTGSKTVTLVIVDTTSGGAHALPHIEITAYGDSAQTANNASSRTGSAGDVTFSLDTGLYYIVCCQPGYTFAGNYVSGVDTVRVTGTQTDTVFCYHADAGMTTVWGLITDLTADSLEDVYVTFDMGVHGNTSVRRNSDSALAYPKTRTVHSDSTGRWEITLYASDALHTSKPSGEIQSDSVLYNVTFSYAGTTMSFKGIDIPDTTSIAWKDLR